MPALAAAGKPRGRSWRSSVILRCRTRPSSAAVMAESDDPSWMTRYRAVSGLEARTLSRQRSTIEPPSRTGIATVVARCRRSAAGLGAASPRVKATDPLGYAAATSRSDGVAILMRSHAHLVQMRKIMNRPGRQELRACSRLPAPDVFVAGANVRAADSSPAAAGFSLRSRSNSPRSCSIDLLRSPGIGRSGQRNQWLCLAILQNNAARHPVGSLANDQMTDAIKYTQLLDLLCRAPMYWATRATAHLELGRSAGEDCDGLFWSRAEYLS